MNNAGKSEPDTKSKIEATTEDGSAQRSPILLIGMTIIVIICLVIGVQAFGILYSIVLPPVPPLPDDAIEVRHTQIDHGVDEWLYEIEQDACVIAQFYESQDGLCRFTTNACGDEPSDNFSFGTSRQHIATCIGEVQFSMFAYRWEANIADKSEGDNTLTQYSLIREVFWTGAVPPRLDPRNGFEFDG